MKNQDSLQDYYGILSFGYLYLVVLDILNETFYYNQLGINILNYSNISDVLLSPIAKITKSVSSTLIFIVLVIVVINLPAYLSKRRDKSWVQKNFGVTEKLTQADARRQLNRGLLFLSALGLLGFFTGTGLGGGYRISEKIENNEIKYNDLLTYSSGKTDTIAIIGKNSAFLFYLKNAEKQLKITPMNNGILQAITDVRKKTEAEIQ